MNIKQFIPSVFVSACLLTAFSPNLCSADDEMYTLASALTKLSAAVESTVGFKSPPPELKDQGLAELSTKHNPKILEPFAEYTVKTYSQNSHAVVLICDKEGKLALLEDAGCTSPMDKHWWRDQPEKDCSFTIKIDEVCQN